MDEIGAETVALWKFWLETKLWEIMPYYNQLYETTVKDYDYMVDLDTTEEFTGNESKLEKATFKSNENMDTDTTDDTTRNSTTDGSVTDKVTGSPISHTMHNDFPQAPLETTKTYATYEDYRQDTLSQDTVTDTLETQDDTIKNIKTTNQETNYSSNNSVDGNVDTTHNIHRKGLNGARSFTDLLLQYRDSLLNIDMMIIDDLSELFMSVY